MDLKLLVNDIDYQVTFTYEQRADLFNKYTIPTNTKFLVPIWELAQYIVSLDKFNTKTFSSFGHGQNILNKDLSKKIEDKRELRIGLNDDTITIRTIDNDAKNIGTYGRYRNMLIFDLSSKTIKISRRIVHFGSYEIVRDLYSKIDEWLVDFGFEKW